MSDASHDVHQLDAIDHLHSLLLDAGLPVVSVGIDKSLDWEQQPTQEQEQQAQVIVDGVDVDTYRDADKADINNRYDEMIQTLDTIQGKDGWSSSDMITAIKYLARNQRTIVRLIKRNTDE